MGVNPPEQAPSDVPVHRSILGAHESIPSKRPKNRRPGPDVVRALAMAGVVVMNYHGYLIIKGARRDGNAWYDVFDPWVGPLSTRFAATFVLTAGVGVTLMTTSSIGDPARTSTMRWRLVKRGLLLYAVGLLVDPIWRGTILPFYGIMFALAALLFTMRSRWVLLVGTVAAFVGAAIRWWRLERQLDGFSTAWLTDPDGGSPRGLVFDVFVNGTHPLFPWLAFFCAGIVLGRVLSTDWWRPAAVGAGLVLYTGATLIDASIVGGRGAVLLNDNPFDRGLVYTASALGTALIAFAVVSWLADRFEATQLVDVLRRAGQLSLTIYLCHILVFKLLVDRLDLIEPDGLTTALVFATTFWVVAIAASVAYQRRFGRGPAEWLYRAITN
jgi:uncharacterized protein